MKQKFLEEATAKPLKVIDDKNRLCSEEIEKTLMETMNIKSKQLYTVW